MVSKITSNDHFEWFLKEYPNRLIVVDFYADWCGPCKKMVPTLEKWAKNKYPEVVFIKVNVETCPELMDRYNIKMMPTFKLCRNQKVIHTVKGADPRTLENLISQLQTITQSMV